MLVVTNTAFLMR
uniref:Uncharacterized protein n=1 Tax=Rhizophora mucronata TaxID=61149 RepID=A0A2P2LBM5_RHIMU